MTDQNSFPLNNIQTQRLDWVDAAKGIAMILVIYLHSGAGIISQTIIGSFHMPVFFFLTGFFLFQKNRTFNDYNKSKLKSLIIPYFIFGIILASYSTFIDVFIKHNDVIPGYRYIGLLVNQRHEPFFGSLWFLLVLFSVEILLFGLHKLIKRNTIRVILCILLSVFGIAIQKYFGSLPLSFDLTMICLVFTEFGYLIYPYINRYEKKIIYAILLSLFIIAVYANYQISKEPVDLYSCRIGNAAPFIIAALCGSLLLIPLAKLLSRNKMILYIGKNSLLYYCLQFVLLIPLNNISKKFVPESISFLMPFILTATVIIILIPVINYINNHHSWMLGRKAIKILKLKSK